MSKVFYGLRYLWKSSAVSRFLLVYIAVLRFHVPPITGPLYNHRISLIVEIFVTRQVYIGPREVEFMTAILSVYQYFLVKNIFGYDIFLVKKIRVEKFLTKNCKNKEHCQTKF